MFQLLVIHQALAPYRVDIFNLLNARFAMRLIFLSRRIANQSLDEVALRRLLSFQPEYVDRRIGSKKRFLPASILQMAYSARGGIVVVPEFSLSSCFFLVFGRLFNLKVIIWTDDNLNSLASESRLRRFVRSALHPLARGMILATDEARQIYPHYSGHIAVLHIVQDEVRLQRDLRSEDSLAAAVKLIKARTLQGKKVLLYVGRLAPEKRVDRLIAAFSRIVATDSSVVLVLVGDGPLRAELESLVQATLPSACVVFNGQANGAELHAWYCLGGVFCLPSQSETFGAVVDEALVAGIPVVCSQAVGAKELIQPGVNGSIVDADDVAALACELKRWLDRATPLESNVFVKDCLRLKNFDSSAEPLIDMLAALGGQ